MCNICKDTKEMILVYGNQEGEWTKAPCQCVGGPEFKQITKDGYALVADGDFDELWYANEKPNW